MWLQGDGGRRAIDVGSTALSDEITGTRHSLLRRLDRDMAWLIANQPCVQRKKRQCGNRAIEKPQNTGHPGETVDERIAVHLPREWKTEGPPCTG